MLISMMARIQHVFVMQYHGPIIEYYTYLKLIIDSYYLEISIDNEFAFLV